MIKKVITCCFIGHRKMNNEFGTEAKLKGLIFGLIEQGVTQFLFGDHSEFNDLCYEIVTKLKKPTRIYAEFISEPIIPKPTNTQKAC